ncbi:isoprenylcysteine carboxylmethyltransferase family protein [Mesorhizobium sp. M0904]|uniref:methyltransferase family protein n=2 Tax=unclassified Mesorhizobium TaxID=325217 RepID=UPI00333A060D
MMESTLDLLLSISSIATLGQYAWSMRGHFQSPSMSQGAMIISAVVVGTALFFLALLWIERQPVAAKIGGFAVELASSALFWWAISVSRKARLRFAFDPDNPDSLVTEGPYSYVRHPFYTSYIIFWIGWGIATWSVWAVVPVAGIVAIYVIAALDEERKFSRTRLAGAYQAYSGRAGLFWPRFARSRQEMQPASDESGSL